MSSAFVGLATDFELLCDDPRNTVLMTKEEMRRFAKYYGSDLLGHRDDEVRVSDV